jgi:hypothetical protein
MQALDDKRKSRTNCALTDIGGNDVKKTCLAQAAPVRRRIVKTR